jgi:hypothetical protein
VNTALNMGAEFFNAVAKTNVAVAVPDGCPRLTRQLPNALIGSLKGSLLAGGLTSCSFAAPK